MTSRPTRFLLFLFLPLLASPAARAQQLYTYNGPFSGSGSGVNPWSTDNWLGGTPVSSATTQLLFTNADLGIYSANNDLGNPFLLNGAFLNSFSQINTTLNSNAGSSLELTGANPFLSVGGPGTFTFGGGPAGTGLVLAPTAGTTTIQGPGNGTLAFGSNATVISGTGGVTVNLSGNGAATVFGANTFSGGVTLNAGALAIGNGGALGSGALTINGGTVRISGTPTVPNPVVLNNDLRFTAGGTLTLSGPVSGPGGVVVSNGQNFSSQTLIFGAPLTYAGPTTVQNSIPRPSGSSGNLGALSLAAGATLGSTQQITVGDNGTLALTGASPHLLNQNQLVLTGGQVYVQGTSAANLSETFGAVAVNGLGTFTVAAGAPNNTLTLGALSRVGNATIFLRGAWNGANNALTFAGGLPTVSDPLAPGGAATGLYTGVVPFATGNNLSGNVNAATRVTYNPMTGVGYISPVDSTRVAQIAVGATLDATTDFQNVNLTGTATVGDARRVNSLSNTASGTVAGTGTLAVSSGAVYAVQGPGSPVSFNGPTLSFGAATGYLHLGGNVQIAGPSSVAGSGGFVVSGFDTPGSQAGGSGAGYTLQFSNAANPFTGGLSVNGNAGVNFTADAQLGAAGGAVTLNGGGLNFNPAAAASVTVNRSIVLGAAGGSLSTVSGYVFTVAGNLTGPGALGVGSTVAANGGTIALTGTNTFSGPLYVNGAGGTVLSVSSDANLGSASAPLVLNGGTLQFAASNTFTKPISLNAASTLDTGANAVTLTSGFTGVVAGGLTKIGAGTLTLAAASPLFSGRFLVGTAMVPGGTLALAGGSLPQVTTLTVNGGGTLAGTGSVGGSVSVAAGGVFAPGTATAPGRLTVGSSLLLPGGTATILDLQGTAAATGYSQAIVGGQLTLGGNLSLNRLAGFNPALGAKFYIFDLTGLSVASGTFANGTGPNGTLFADNAGDTYQINYADRDPADTSNALGNDLSLTVVGVPEPSTWALLGAGAGVLALVTRRRRAA